MEVCVTSEVHRTTEAPILNRTNRPHFRRTTFRIDQTLAHVNCGTGKQTADYWSKRTRNQTAGFEWVMNTRVIKEKIGKDARRRKTDENSKDELRGGQVDILNLATRLKQ